MGRGDPDQTAPGGLRSNREGRRVWASLFYNCWNPAEELLEEMNKCPGTAAAYSAPRGVLEKHLVGTGDRRELRPEALRLARNMGRTDLGA